MAQHDGFFHFGEVDAHWLNLWLSTGCFGVLDFLGPLGEDLGTLAVVDEDASFHSVDMRIVHSDLFVVHHGE